MWVSLASLVSCRGLMYMCVSGVREMLVFRKKVFALVHATFDF